MAIINQVCDRSIAITFKRIRVNAHLYECHSVAEACEAPPRPYSHKTSTGAWPHQKEHRCTMSFLRLDSYQMRYARKLVQNQQDMHSFARQAKKRNCTDFYRTVRQSPGCSQCGSGSFATCSSRSEGRDEHIRPAFQRKVFHMHES